jgi:hypothetical protein
MRPKLSELSTGMLPVGWQCPGSLSKFGALPSNVIYLQCKIKLDGGFWSLVERKNQLHRRSFAVERWFKVQGPGGAEGTGWGRGKAGTR